MRMTLFQKLATAALVALLGLMVVGAVVRVTGSGLGCPDWPMCWGCLIPPSSVDEINFSKLPMEKFKDAAAKEGLDRDTINEQSLRGEFNVRHAWTEYINRLSSGPVSLLTLATFIAAFRHRERPLVFWMAFGAVLLLVANALVGAVVVSTLLKPAIITGHLALAMLMLGALAYCACRGTEDPWQIELKGGQKPLRIAVLLLLAVVVAEGFLGTQVRQMTDQMSRAHVHEPRSQWIGELEQSWKYLVHRSFSWAVLFVAIWAWLLSKRHRVGGPGRVEKAVLGVVIFQMLLGVIMSQIHIYAWVQVVHIGLASLLLALIWVWWFGLSAGRKWVKPMIPDVSGNGARQIV
ncbi:COX15/CtaA family protein [Luteolibacter pohnpeiensis]|uniref:COX15/CtaA family protein n=1 Tax=Luteolibacter pohnpeiensis TaxID=454153 RepID=A0A934S4D5_9BACT|nr:COX15/CtaA family protein [Luteolibacter pohnpeiensis]MBK1880904.1 COX15/CtaA family protein [Luteolibacter pohnpeiensis]